MPFGLKDPRPQLECAQCGHKERISPVHAAAAATNKGQVLCKACGGLMWMPGFGPAASSAPAEPAALEPAALQTVYVRRGDAGFGIVLDEECAVIGGAGHTCETIPLGARVVSVNGVEVSCKADIIACIKDVAVSGQAEFTFRPVSPEPAPAQAAQAPPVEPLDEEDVAAAAAAVQLKRLEEEFEAGALTEDQYVAAKLSLIEPPGAGAIPSPRVAPPAGASTDDGGVTSPSLELAVPLAQPQLAEDKELTPRTEAELVSRYLGEDHASEAAAVLSTAESRPESEPEPEADASSRVSVSGVLGGLASIDPRPILECSNQLCGNKERAKVADGVGAVGAFLSSSNHHVKCSKCGSLLWMPGATKPGHSQVSAATIEAWTREFDSSVPAGWEDAAQKADKHSRSTLIRLRNRAPAALVLGPAETISVESGVWIIEPPAVIQPGEEVVFGVGSRGLLRESGIGAAEAKLTFVLEPPPELDPCGAARDRVEFAIRVTNPVISVPNVNERRCVAVTTPPEGCGTIHIGAVPDHHNNVVCITVAEPERADPPDLYMDIRAEQQDTTAPPETIAERPADEAPGAAEAALSGLTLVELAERAGLDAELLDGMLEAMDCDELAVATMLREQVVANPELQPAPAPTPASKPELSEEELAERYLKGGAGSAPRRRRDDCEAVAESDNVGELVEEAEAPQLRAEEQKKQLLAEAAQAQAAREAARAEFEQEMVGATNTVKKRQQDEAAALSAAAQVKEAQEVLRDNAQKLGEMSDTTDEMRDSARDFAAGMAALNQKKKGGGFLGGLLS